ncbi:MAG: RagB/SusD family nutrient uptake outer membrane protein [Bacteroidales bacterium]|nr:RagB/SusD family nutrient uptake outer membrane protein [Bacteroidales bacterium]
MKTFRIIIITCLIIITGVSCEDFLEETSKTGKTEEMVYSTADDLENLTAVCYAFLRGLYGKESMVALGELGTDLWNNAEDPNTAVHFNTYITLSPLMDWPIDEAFEYFYVAVNSCNLAIENVSAATDLLTDETRIRLECEAKFLRAFYYWIMVETWGPMQLNKEVVREAGTVSRRDSEQDIYEFMFEDVQYCIDNLLPNTEPNSRVTWLAAKAFKVRLALTYACDYYKNKVKVDYKGKDYYAIALQEANDVIDASANLGKGLYTSYADVWDIDKSFTPDNSEFIWAVDYYDEIGPSNIYNHIPTRPRESSSGSSQEWSGLFTRQPGSGGGNCQHLWLTPRFYSQTTADGGPSLANILHRVAGETQNYTLESDVNMVTVDVGYWYVRYMGYGKFGPTKFMVDLFNETIDQRWDVSFVTAWYKYPDIVPQYYVTDTSLCLYPLMSVGTQADTALFYSKHPATQAQIHRAHRRYKILDVNNTYEEDGTPKRGSLSSSTHIYPHFAKFMNTQSTINLPFPNFSDYYSKRDFPVFRMSEIYLIAAEAALQTSGSAAAYPYLLSLANARAIGGNGTALLTSYGVNSQADIDIDFILDERAREFVGENIRWFDLKRTMKLEERVMAYNIVARTYFDPETHYLRPIPSIQMDASSNASDSVGVGFWQNPGY